MSNMDNENTAVPQQAWSASDVLRLALEDGDFLGFIEVNDNIKTLAHVRQKINEELDHVPKKLISTTRWRSSWFKTRKSLLLLLIFYRI